MWYQIQDQQVKLSILAKPNAKKSALLKVDHQGLHIALHAKPHNEEANKELIIYLGKLLQLPKSKIILQQGKGSRHKKIVVPLTNKVQELLNDPLKFII